MQRSRFVLVLGLVALGLVRPAAAQKKAPATNRESFATVLRAPWGSGPGQLGRRFGSEQNPEMPMSFLVGADGSLHVLDQVNARIEVFSSGRHLRSVPLPADVFQDFAFDVDGGYVLLDRLVGGTLAFVDPLGKIDHEVPLVGRHVPEAGSVTALFAHDDGFWVEVDHEHLVRVATVDGSADAARPRIEGRRMSDGRVVSARLEGPTSARVLIRQGKRRLPLLARVAFPVPVLALVGLEPDASGHVSIAAHLFVESEKPPYDVVREEVQIVRLDRDGREVSRRVLPPPVGPEEQLRLVRVGLDGAVYQLATDASGVVVRKVAP